MSDQLTRTPATQIIPQADVTVMIMEDKILLRMEIYVFLSELSLHLQILSLNICPNLNERPFDVQLDLFILQYSRLLLILCDRWLHRKDFLFFSSQSRLSVYILFTQFPRFILTMTSMPLHPGSLRSSSEVESALMG